MENRAGDCEGSYELVELDTTCVAASLVESTAYSAKENPGHLRSAGPGV